jgi:hypothetical protein
VAEGISAVVLIVAAIAVLGACGYVVHRLLKRRR